MSQITHILCQIDRGDRAAAEKLLPLVYQELRRLAAKRLSKESPGQTLQATALVHEAYLRLVDVEHPQSWHGRGHFFGAAAEAMRRILVERARRRQRIRHGGGRRRLDLDQFDPEQLAIATDDRAAENLLALDQALTRLTAEDSAAAEVVKLRYFAGLTVEQTADALGISARTAKRRWAYAKAWLYRELSTSGDTRQ